MWSARIFFFFSFFEVSEYLQSWSLSTQVPESKAKLQLHGKDTGEMSSPVWAKSQLHSLQCSDVQSHISWLDQLEFSFEEKSVPGLVSGPFLHSGHSCRLRRALPKPAGKVIRPFSLEDVFTCVLCPETLYDLPTQCLSSSSEEHSSVYMKIPWQEAQAFRVLGIICFNIASLPFTYWRPCPGSLNNCLLTPSEK